MQKIAIDDFTGGRENFDDQVLLKPNVCSSGSANVWAPNKALIPAPGISLVASFTGSATATAMVMPWFGTDDAVSTANKIFYRIQLPTTTAARVLFGSSTTFTDSLTALGYTTGSISVSGASRVSATGSGTAWSTHASAGDIFIVNATSSAKYEIKSVEDDTHLTLVTQTSAVVATGSSYIIQPGIDFDEIAVASLNGYLCFCTTGNIMQQYDGTQVKRLAAAPKAAFLTVFKNYMFAARSSTATSRLYWSAIKDPTSWPATNFQDLDVLNGQIQGLFAFGSELLVFKNRGLYKVLGDTFDPSNPSYFTFKIATPPDFIFASNSSVAVHQGYIVFYAGGKFYRYKPGRPMIENISKHILRDLPTSFGTYTDCAPNADQRIRAISYNDFYLVKGLVDTNNSSRYMMLILDQNWSWWYMPQAGTANTTVAFDDAPFAVVPSTTARPRLSLGMKGMSKVFTMDLNGPTYGTNYDSNSSSTFATTNASINCTWISKEFNIEFGTFKWLIVYLQKQSAGTNTLSVDWSIDQGSYVTNAVDMTIGRGQVIRAVLPIQQKGTTIQIRITHNTVSEVFKIYAVQIFYELDQTTRLL